MPARLVLVTHPAYARHDTGEHPERPARFVDTARLLEPLGLTTLVPEPATLEALALVHPTAHAERIEAFCRAGGGRIDDDTVACPASYEVARLAAGGAIEGVRQVLEGHARQALVVARPPGHHALAEETMGFCFFNNAAIAARYAQRHYGLERVAIIDWDVHHGNGTEAIFYDDPSVLYVSTHQHPNWPGTGQVDHTGRGAGTGFNLNVPLPIGTGNAGFLRAFRELVGPVVTAFAPELVILSAGYDAHWADPLGRMGLTVEGFAALTHEVVGWAEASAQGRLVAIMEGGYHLGALSEGIRSTALALLDRPVTDALGPSPYPEPTDEVGRWLARARAAQAPHWPV